MYRTDGMYLVGYDGGILLLSEDGFRYWFDGSRGWDRQKSEAAAGVLSGGWLPVDVVPFPSGVKVVMGSGSAWWLEGWNLDLVGELMELCRLYARSAVWCEECGGECLGECDCCSECDGECECVGGHGGRYGSGEDLGSLDEEGGGEDSLLWCRSSEVEPEPGRFPVQDTVGPSDQEPR